jgi:hypothetical protein
MGETMAGPDLAARDVIDTFGSLYCHNLVAARWADPVAHHWEGVAIFLLSDELPRVAERARAAVRRLAGRWGDLGCAVTADPRQLVGRAPGDNEFTIPRLSGPAAAGPVGAIR